MQETPSFTSFTIQYWELFLWIIGERKESVKVPSTQSFFANRASNFVLQNFATYKKLHSRPKYHPWNWLDDDGDYDADDNYDIDANCDYEEDYKYWVYLANFN